jgi:hypothetical protein
MNLNLEWLIGLLATTAAASLGAFVSGRMGLIQADRSETIRLRRETADGLISALTALRLLFRDAETSRDFAQWAQVVEVAYDAVEDARHRLPGGWRHLKFSLRAAISTAVGGVAHVDLQPPRDQEQLADYDLRWAGYAMEYIDTVLYSIRRWRDAKASTAPKLALASYDQWLAKNGLYNPQ